MAGLLRDAEVELLLRSMLAQQCSRLRSTFVPMLADSPGHLGEAPWDLDSLAVTEAARSVGRFFCLEHAGLEDQLLRYPDLRSWREIVLDSRSCWDEGFRFTTSGTTGAPKEVFHAVGDLWNEAEWLAELFAGVRQIHAFVRLHHIYGFLYAILLPRAMGLKCRVHEAAPGREFWSTPPGSLLVGTPAYYSRLVDVPGRAAPGCLATSSTEPLPPRLYSLLRERGIERICEIYGSSETLGVGYRWAPEDPFRRFGRLKPGALNELQDHLEWLDGSHFRVAGRRDARVKHRGALIDLGDYVARLRSLDGVQDAQVMLQDGALVAYIEAADRPAVLARIGSCIRPRPDEIIWGSSAAD